MKVQWLAASLAVYLVVMWDNDWAEMKVLWLAASLAADWVE